MKKSQFKNSLKYEDLFVKNCKHSRKSVKRYILKNNILPYVCILCDQDENWLGKKMSLILDHINGVYNDNRIENLRFVCPNCNSTLDTHCGKNVKNKKSKREINKLKYENKQKQYIDKILKSNIDFSSLGWVTKVSEIINQKPQKVNKWMKRFMFDFYQNNCFKRSK